MQKSVHPYIDILRIELPGCSQVIRWNKNRFKSFIPRRTFTSFEVWFVFRWNSFFPSIISVFYPPFVINWLSLFVKSHFKHSDIFLKTISLFCLSIFSFPFSLQGVSERSLSFPLTLIRVDLKCSSVHIMRQLNTCPSLFYLLANYTVFIIFPHVLSFLRSICKIFYFEWISCLVYETCSIKSVTSNILRTEEVTLHGFAVTWRPVGFFF